MGPLDPARVSPDELGPKGVYDHLIYRVGLAVIANSKKKKARPFSADLPPGSVIH